MFEAFDIMLMLGGGCLSVNMSLGYGQEGGLGHVLMNKSSTATECTSVQR